ncbi:TIGR03088 family PEP-CTERM/XrtA system glycosyltransferase [Paucibacter sp. AS339]|uniref:TIGR03088 family PEP-CTERM/XrtA system glycosyltransferase n=1 Tax=Paucibacter hankyongi TaxID=3133434 RepID=UPI0030AC766D
MTKPVPLIAHLIYCLDTGGLERVMVNCISQLSQGECRHVVISLTHVTEFANQLPKGVDVYSMHKRPGLDLVIHLRLWRLLRKIRPNVLHSYNLATLEYHPVAWFAGVRGHIHAEHGRDISDPKGENKKHQYLRRIISPFLQSYVAVSADLHQWLAKVIGINERKCRLIANGINTDRFQALGAKLAPFTFIHVARLAAVKDQLTLLQATALLRSQTTLPFQLMVIGDGPERDRLKQAAESLGLAAPLIQWLGERRDIAELMAQSHVFVLSSIAEGIPMTVLEAMASGLAIISTEVGGLPELIGNTEGVLVPTKDAQAMATAMLGFLEAPDSARSAGAKSRERACAQFSEQAMVAKYLALYLEVS